MKMSAQLQEHFEAVTQKTTKQVSTQGRLCEFTGQPQDKVEKAQSEALAELYRNQLRTVIAIFCLVKNANRHGGWDTESEEAYRNLEGIAQGSNFSARQIAEELNGLSEEEAILRVRAMMNDIHTNCSLIAEKLGIEFVEEERDIN